MNGWVECAVVLALCGYSYIRGLKSAREQANRADRLRDLEEERLERREAEEKRRPSGAPRVGEEASDDCDGAPPSDWELGKAYYAPDRRAFKHYPAVYVGGEWTRTE